MLLSKSRLALTIKRLLLNSMKRILYLIIYMCACVMTVSAQDVSKLKGEEKPTVSRTFRNKSMSDVLLNDGEFELLLVRRLKKPTDIFRMIRRIKARDYDGDSLIYQKITGARFLFDAPEPWSLDGEFGGRPEIADFRLLPQAIEIFAPKNSLFLPEKEAAGSEREA